MEDRGTLGTHGVFCASSSWNWGGSFAAFTALHTRVVFESKTSPLSIALTQFGGSPFLLYMLGI